MECVLDQAWMPVLEMGGQGCLRPLVGIPAGNMEERAGEGGLVGAICVPVRGFRCGYVRATTVFRMDCLVICGLCFLYTYFPA